jgi:DNA-binding NtrC family response regulator
LLSQAGDYVTFKFQPHLLRHRALDEGIQFDVAIVDLILEDGNATPLFQVLSERGTPVVITTGDKVDQGLPALSMAITILQKPYLDRDLINALMKCASTAPLVPLATPPIPPTKKVN